MKNQLEKSLKILAKASFKNSSENLSETSSKMSNKESNEELTTKLTRKKLSITTPKATIISKQTNINQLAWHSQQYPCF